MSAPGDVLVGELVDDDPGPSPSAGQLEALARQHQAFAYALVAQVTRAGEAPAEILLNGDAQEAVAEILRLAHIGAGALAASRDPAARVSQVIRHANRRWRLDLGF